MPLASPHLTSPLLSSPPHPGWMHPSGIVPPLDFGFLGLPGHSVVSLINPLHLRFSIMKSCQRATGRGKRMQFGVAKRCDIATPLPRGGTESSGPLKWDILGYMFVYSERMPDARSTTSINPSLPLLSHFSQLFNCSCRRFILGVDSHIPPTPWNIRAHLLPYRNCDEFPLMQLTRALFLSYEL